MSFIHLACTTWGNILSMPFKLSPLYLIARTVFVERRCEGVAFESFVQGHWLRHGVRLRDSGTLLQSHHRLVSRVLVLLLR